MLRRQRCGREGVAIAVSDLCLTFRVCLYRATLTSLQRILYKALITIQIGRNGRILLLNIFVDPPTSKMLLREIFAVILIRKTNGPDLLCHRVAAVACYWLAAIGDECVIYGSNNASMLIRRRRYII